MANLVFDFLHNYHAGERRDSEPANTYQYDEGHVIEANLPQVITSCEIHYWIRGMEEAEAYVPTSITPNSDGTCTVIGHVPNEYFRTNGELRVYIVVTDGDASITTYEGRIQVYPRSMPDDYVDDDPENEATRVLIEAQEAAATATAAAETCEEVRDSIPEDYSTLSGDVEDLKDGLTAIESDVTDLKEDIAGLSGLSEEVKVALLQIASKVAYIDDDGQDYYDALQEALYPIVSISAVYTQSGTVYTSDSLDSLKPDLVVTALYDDQTTETVTTYTLSGTLTEGTSIITVTYGGKTTTFTVTVTDYWKTIEFEKGPLSKATSGGIYYVWANAVTTARARMKALIPNDGYTFTVTDSTKYSLSAYDPNTNVADTITVQGVQYQGYKTGRKSISWSASDSASTPYVWVAFKKNDGTDFTDQEIANMYGTVFTVS